MTKYAKVFRDTRGYEWIKIDFGTGNAALLSLYTARELQADLEAALAEMEEEKDA